MPGVQKSVPDLGQKNELSKWFALNLGLYFIINKMADCLVVWNFLRNFASKIINRQLTNEIKR